VKKEQFGGPGSFFIRPTKLTELGGLLLKLLIESVDSSDMDGRALFQSVLNPRENLLWIGEPPCASGRRLGAAAIGLLFVFTVALFFRNAPIPPHMGFQRMAGLVFGVALFCTIPFSLIQFSLRGDRTKSFALTDYRLLMTVGPRREDVRMVALMALAPVEVMRDSRGRHDKMLRFSLPGTRYCAADLDLSRKRASRCVERIELVRRRSGRRSEANRRREDCRHGNDLISATPPVWSNGAVAIASGSSSYQSFSQVNRSAANRSASGVDARIPTAARCLYQSVNLRQQTPGQRPGVLSLPGSFLRE
jgi:hypothetical protein